MQNFYILYMGNDFIVLFHVSMSYSPLDYEALLLKIFYTFICLSRQPDTYLACKISL